MTTRIARPHILLCLVAVLTFAACGGGSSGGGGGTPTITSVSVNCASASVTTGLTDQCTATVSGTGSYSSAVTWTATAGTVSATGLFTAPAAAGNATVTATSAQDPSKHGDAPITINAGPTITSVSVNCPESSLAEGLLEHCVATVQGTGSFSTAVSWSATAGSVDSNGVFTAPAAAGPVTITATSTADNSKHGPATVTVSAPQKSTFIYKGVNHVSWALSDYGSPAGATSEADIPKSGSDWAGVLVTQYMDTKNSNTIAPLGWTPSDTDVTAAITHLHANNVKVMLKPHVDPNDGNWRGVITPTDVNAWFASYTTFIVHYAQLAQANGVEMLCIGTEFASMTGSANKTAWNNVITAIRGVYTGKLTYAANATSAGDEFTSVSFWDNIDVLGLDGYFPLTNHAGPTVAELVAAWSHNLNGENIVQDVENFVAAHPGKEVMFTEIGYRSQAGANMHPWDWSVAAAVDNIEQQNCYEALYQVWGQNPAMKGHFLWAWPVAAPAAGDTDYNPRNKPAETVMQNWLK